MTNERHKEMNVLPGLCILFVDNLESLGPPENHYNAVHIIPLKHFLF